jgi:hypothetical protein
MAPHDENQYPLYGSTFTAYTLSPLYHGQTSLLTNLALHSRRLREAVTGDALRGAQISAEIAGLPSAGAPSGAFRSCSWDLLGDEDAWTRAHPDDAEDQISAFEPTTAEDSCGIHVEVRYERATHSAILLGDAAKKSDAAGFTNFPLLLVRMPAALKDTFVNYLATAFDARVSPLKFRSRFIGSAVELILARAIKPMNSGFSVDVDGYPKGAQLQLGFPSMTPQLKTIHVELKQSDLLAFLREGQYLWKRKVNKDSKSPVVGPFTAALEKYLSQNLALDLNHPAVMLAKVSIGRFALANEGKIKIMDSSSSAQDLWGLLLEEVQQNKLPTQSITQATMPSG